jgi:hypothetical protein
MTGKDTKSDTKLDEAVNNIAAQATRLEEGKAKPSGILRETKNDVDLSLLSRQITSDILENNFFKVNLTTWLGFE